MCIWNKIPCWNDHRTPKSGKIWTDSFRIMIIQGWRQRDFGEDVLKFIVILKRVWTQFFCFKTRKWNSKDLAFPYGIYKIKLLIYFFALTNSFVPCINIGKIGAKICLTQEFQKNVAGKGSSEQESMIWKLLIVRLATHTQNLLWKPRKNNSNVLKYSSKPSLFVVLKN